MMKGSTMTTARSGFTASYAGLHRGPYPGKVRQRGVVAVWVALASVALITATFLAIDTGRLYYTQRQLQKLANLAAVAGAQVASGCSGPEADGTAGNLSVITTQVETFLRSNGGAGAVAYLTGVNGFPKVEVGRIKLGQAQNTQLFEPLTEGDSRINAVRVNLSQPQPSPFVGFLTGGGTLKASATAMQPLAGTFTVGSTLLSLDNGLLGDTVGSLVCPSGTAGDACRANVIGLDLLSHQSGLVNTSVSLGVLATALGVNVQDLSNPLDATVTLPGALNGLVDNLPVDQVGAGVSQLLQDLAAAAAGNTEEIPLGTLLGTVDTLDGQVPGVNLLDLIMALGAASKADENGGVVPIALPAEVNIPGVITTTAYLRILQPPQSNLPGELDQNTANLLSGAGRPGVARASTSQIQLLVRMQSQAVNSLLAVLNTTLRLIPGLNPEVMSELNLGVDVDVAKSVAYLDGVQCAVGGVNGGSPIAQLSVSPSLANVAVGTFTGTPVAGAEPPALAETGTIDLVKTSLGNLSLGFTSVGVNGSETPIALEPVTEFVSQADIAPRMPLIYDAVGGSGISPVTEIPTNPQTVGSPTSVDLNLGLQITGTLGNLLNTLGLTALVESTLTLVTDVVNEALSPAIDTLLETLGIKLGTGTVRMNAVLIGRPEKVSTCVPGNGGGQGCLVAEPDPQT
jgi:uncharacterized membrane protein